MFFTIVNAILPVAFVILLGWFAGYKNIIDKSHSKSLATYVMTFSFPCLLFYITATTKLSVLFNFTFVIAFLIGLMGSYIFSYCIHKYLLKRDTHQAGQGAFVCAFPDMAFMGIPIFMELLGQQALISIVIGNIISSLVMIPLTIILLESKTNKNIKLSKLLIDNAINVIKKPLVFAPILGVLYALTGVKFPLLLEHCLKLIGESTSGVSLFALGLIMSSYAIRFSKQTFLNIGIKNILQPLFMLVLTMIFGITGARCLRQQ